MLIALWWMGCAGAPEDPAWAMDVVHLEPDGVGVVGIQTWSVFDDRWAKGRRAGRFVCTVLVGWSGSPAEDGCDACNRRWRVEATLWEHDCPTGTVAQNPVLTGLDGVGLGDVAEDLAQDGPWEDARGVWARYGGRWVPFGWAGREDGSAGGWDGTAAMEIWPGFAWPLGGLDSDVAVDVDRRRLRGEVEPL